jgi:hypothetical protein
VVLFVWRYTGRVDRIYDIVRIKRGGDKTGKDL